MDLLDIYTDYLICQNKYATATGLSEMLEGDIAHDKHRSGIMLKNQSASMSVLVAHCFWMIR